MRFAILMVLASMASGYTQPNSTVVAPTFVVNLDLAPEDRWTDIVKIYQSSAPLIVDYFTAQALELIMGNLDSLLGDYGAEMRGVAKAYGLDLGVIVGLNFAYELRKWAGGHPNVTTYEPHVCTSIVAQDKNDQIFHGRNMDWNLPENLRNLSVQIDFQRNNQTIYHGATYVGFVVGLRVWAQLTVQGIFTGMYPGRYSVSVNERNLGGAPIIDALNAILGGATSVTHLLRTTFEKAHIFEDALQVLRTTRLSAPVYYIIAGTTANQGAVITRSMDYTQNLWRLPNPTGQPWYLLQTNYDHWLPDPVHDARRTYGDNHMNQLGQDTGATLDGIFDVISTWPVMNNFTCQTVMMHPASGYFRAYARYFY